MVEEFTRRIKVKPWKEDPGIVWNQTYFYYFDFFCFQVFVQAGERASARARN